MAIKRAWPNAISQPAESTWQDGSLFIEDAINNLELEEGLINDIGEGLTVASLQKEGTSIFRANIDGVLGCYPFKNLRAAADLLFLRGSSDMAIAKQAIVSFSYYNLLFLGVLSSCHYLEHCLIGFLNFYSFYIICMIATGQFQMKNGEK